MIWRFIVESNGVIGDIRAWRINELEQSGSGGMPLVKLNWSNSAGDASELFAPIMQNYGNYQMIIEY